MPFFLSLSPASKCIFAASVSKHLLAAEGQKIKPNNSDMEKSERDLSKLLSFDNYKLTTTDCTEKLFL
jgi:hypothetical protein